MAEAKRTFYPPAQMWTTLRHISLDEGVTTSSIIVALIARWLRDRDPSVIAEAKRIDAERRP